MAGRAAASRLRLPTSATSIKNTTSLLANIAFYLPLSDVETETNAIKRAPIKSARARSTAINPLHKNSLSARDRAAAAAKSFRRARSRRFGDHALLGDGFAVLLDFKELAEHHSRCARFVAFDAHDFAVVAARAGAQEEHGARRLCFNERAIAALVAEDARDVQLVDQVLHHRFRLRQAALAGFADLLAKLGAPRFDHR